MKKSVAILVMGLGCLALPLAGCDSLSVSSSSAVPSSSNASSSATSSSSQSSSASSASSSSEASSSASNSSSVVSSSSADPLLTAAEGAAKMLNFDTQAGKGLTNRTFPLYPVINYSADYQFQVNYSIIQETPYDGASATLHEDTDPDLVSPDYSCTVVAPYKDPQNSAPWVVFVLTATLIYNGSPAVVNNGYYGFTGQEVYTKNFNIRVDPISYVAIKDIPSQTSGAALASFGYYIGKYDATTDYCWVADGDAAVTAYRPSTTYASFAIGSVVKLIGSYSPYSGLPELASGCSVVASTVEEAAAAGITLTAPTVLNWDGTYALQAKDCSRQITFTCTINSVKVTSTSGTYMITVGSVSSNLELYLVYASMGTTKSAPWSSVKAGDVLKVAGWISYYAPYWEIINPSIVA